MMDTALLAIEKATREGRSNGDVLLIRNDADAKGMSRTYLDRIYEVAGEHHDADAFSGNLRWQTEKFADYPGFGVVTNLLQGIQILVGRYPEIQVTTSGANTIIRAASLAAVGGLGTSSETGAGSDDVEIRRRLYAARGSGSTGKIPALYGSAYPSGNGTNRAKRVPIRVVTGATIDTDASRLLSQYVSPQGIKNPWQNFDEGGYAARPDVESTGPEDPDHNIGQIADRIERDVNDLVLSSWYRGETARPRAALALMWGTKDKEGNQIYSLEVHGGKATFHFTEAGRVWLRNRLMRDTLGRYDPYGTRSRRHLYNETHGGAKKPVGKQAPFVQPQPAKI
jgi:hypothetical protein